MNVVSQTSSQHQSISVVSTLNQRYFVMLFRRRQNNVHNLHFQLTFNQHPGDVNAILSDSKVLNQTNRTWLEFLVSITGE